MMDETHLSDGMFNVKDFNAVLLDQESIKKLSKIFELIYYELLI